MKKVRHGDMFLYKVSAEKVKNLKGKKTNRLNVGEGEVSNHFHAIYPIGNAEVIEYAEEGKEVSVNDDKIYFEVKNGDAAIFHNEHNPILLEEGIWVRLHQSEFNPFTELISKIRD